MGIISNVFVPAKLTSNGEHTIFNWTQLLDGKKAITDVCNRKIQSENPERMNLCPMMAVVGSDVLIPEGKKIVKRSFWP